ncbi:MAG: hypothetical protein A4E20_10860 [Nitrospira sp. SG-bin2]|uniref:hypothetical protein n=1 Tax=Nitrospira cf. moscoviensis SBR1015 TaxID=96242 RepID=UPI000A0D2A55|nr:hypothetical protein [Nitrospira cf. moscoviensis SBR1015]OQW34512.1 MAG: hypothetical protein A4E20_10860 [Nitrospira sp. SG-bin2]
MAAVLAGEAAVRIVPTVRNFHSEVRRKLKEQPHRLEVEVTAEVAKADAKMAEWRKAQGANDVDVSIAADTKRFDAALLAARERARANAVNVPIKGDTKHFDTAVRRIERDHTSKFGKLRRALIFTVVVAGLDALPALAYGAGSAAAGLDALGKSAFALPGVLGGALASVGALAIGLHGVGDALKAYSQDTASASQNAKKLHDNERELLSAKRNLTSAIRDQKREIEDLNAEMHRSSLNEADALLSIQEDLERLRKGGFNTITEYQRAQLQLMQDTDHLSEVRRRNIRTIEDANKANAEGVMGSERVSEALERVARAAESIHESQISKASEALAKLSPNARSTVEALHSLSGEWKNLVQMPVSDHLFAGMDRSLKDLAHKTLPALGSGLSGVSDGLNSNFKALFSSLGSGQNTSLMTRLFGGTEGGLENASRSLDKLVHGFLTIASANFLPRLGDAFAQVFERFDKFANKVSQDGSLDKWINTGLKSLSSLGNGLLNIFSMFSSVSQAFDAISGHAAGFVGSLETGTKKWAEFLKSDKGQDTLMNYFRHAKDFTSKLVDALKNVKIFVHDVIEATRDWSQRLLDVIGGFSKLAGWIERNTGLLKPLIELYLTLKIAAPIVHALTGAWTMYSRVMTGLSAGGGALATTQTRYDALKTSMFNLGKQATDMSGQARVTTKDVSAMGSSAGGAVGKVGAVGGATVTATRGISSMGEAAKGAAGKIAGGPVSLLAASGNLLRFIGPGLAFTAAIVTVTTLITQLGKAHELAAQQAQTQANALDRLKGSLESTTGAATTATAAETGKSFEDFTIPGIGKVNINKLAEEAGIPKQDLVRAASDPSAEGLRASIRSKIKPQLISQFESSAMYRDHASDFQGAHLTPSDVIDAAMGDPAKLEVYRNFIAHTPNLGLNVLGGMPGISIAGKMLGAPGLDRIGSMGRVPTLTDVLQQLGPLGQIGFALQTTSDSQIRQSQINAGGAEAARGRGELSPSGLGAFRDFNPDPIVRKDNDDRPIVTLNVTPTEKQIDAWAEQGITVVNRLEGGGVTVSLPHDSNMVQGFSEGGLVEGIGGPTDDLNFALLSPKEHVTKAAAVDYYGEPLFHSLNNMEIPRHGIGGWFSGGGDSSLLDTARHDPAAAIAEGISGSATSQVAGAPGIVKGRGRANSPSYYLAPQPTSEKLGDEIRGSATSRAHTEGPQGEARIGGQPAKPQTVLPFVSPPTIFPNTTKTALPQAPPAPPPVNPQPQNPPPPGNGNTADPAQRPTPVGHWQDGSFIADPGQPGQTGYWYYGKWITGADGKGPDGAAGDFPTPQVPTQPPAVTPYTQSSTTASVPSVPVGNTPIYSVTPGPGGMPRIAPTGPVMAQMRSVIDSLVGTPYQWGGWSPAGVDCSGLVSLVANIASGRDPWSSRFATGTELQELTARGFLPGKGGPGTLTVGWNATHTALTLPDGTAVSSGESGGVQYGGGGSEQSQFTNWMYLPVDSGALDSLMPGMSGLGIPGLTDMGGFGGPAYLQPQNILKFFTGQAQNIGSAASSIGLGLISGFTGLDFSSLLGSGQQLGNGLIDAFGNSSMAGGSILNDMAADDMQRYLNGQLPLGYSGASYNPGGGAEQYRPLVRQILQQVGPQYGVTNIKAWEDAIIRQIKTESNGNPDPIHGDGGAAAGLLQFHLDTFNSNNVLGGSYTDPAAQIAAVIPYVTKKYGMNPDGSPKGIGLGKGFKAGGFPDGSALVSTGEFITNNKATAFYGPGLFNALNNMSIPRAAIQGFKNGGFPRGIPRFEDGGFPPLPGFGPSPIPQPPQSPGPLPLEQPNAAAPASTGGPPGPGATAPAPDPGGLPQVSDALAGLGAPGQSDLPQPGVDPGSGADPRGTLGAAPQSQDHLHPALSQGIQGAFNTAGSIAAMAASLGGNAAAPGAGSAAGAGIQAGAQIAGSIATGAANILSSLMVGTVTPGSTAQASGIPLLPQRQPMQTGVPPVNQRVYNGGIHVTNLDEFKRTTEMMDAQAQMPWISKF